jgi:hypothetical protein
VKHRVAHTAAHPVAGLMLRFGALVFGISGLACTPDPFDLSRYGPLTNEVIVDAALEHPTQVRLQQWRHGASGAARCEWRIESNGARTIVIENVNDFGSAFGRALWLTLTREPSGKLTPAVFTIEHGAPDLVVAGALREPAIPRQLLTWTGHVVLNTDTIDVRGTDVWGALAIEFETAHGRDRVAAVFSARVW